MIYEFKSGSHPPKGAIPEEVQAALQAIRTSSDGLTADAVADHVEGEFEQGRETPLAAWFTWDPELGMRKLHVLEAGHVIRAIAVREVHKSQQIPVRAWVLVRDNGEQSYEHIAKVLKEPDQTSRLLDQIGAEKKSVDDKFNELLALVQLLTRQK